MKKPAFLLSILFGAFLNAKVAAGTNQKDPQQQSSGKQEKNSRPSGKAVEVQSLQNVHDTRNHGTDAVAVSSTSSNPVRQNSLAKPLPAMSNRGDGADNVRIIPSRKPAKPMDAVAKNKRSPGSNLPVRTNKKP